MEKLRTLVAVVVMGVSLVSCCQVTVARTLRNGEPLDATKWTVVDIYQYDWEKVLARITTPYINSEINIYFANNNKNVLVVNLFGGNIMGYKYETPHGNRKKFVHDEMVQQIKSNILEATIPKAWFPINVTRISASVDVNGVIHNFYASHNYDISLHDTMVVDEFKKIKWII